MRFYNNIGMALAYLFGMGAKSSHDKFQNAIDNRDNRKETESTSQYFSSNETERAQRGKVMERRERWALRCLVICFICIASGIVALLFSPALSLTLFLSTILPALYGVWYALFGKYW